MTRGRRGSLALRRRALPSPPSCRFIPALSQPGPTSPELEPDAAPNLPALVSASSAKPGTAPTRRSTTNPATQILDRTDATDGTQDEVSGAAPAAGELAHLAM